MSNLAYSKNTQLGKDFDEQIKSKKQLLEIECDELVRKVIKNGKNECVTCNKKDIGWYDGKKNKHGIQVGHFVSRAIKEFRWDLKNCHPQCTKCNQMHEVRPHTYTKFMLERYGKEVVQQMLWRKKQPFKRTTAEMEEIKKELLKNL